MQTYQVIITGDLENGPADGSTDQVTLLVAADHEADAKQKARMIVLRLRNDIVKGLASFNATEVK